jgi:hypothetical protein
MLTRNGMPRRAGNHPHVSPVGRTQQSDRTQAYARINERNEGIQPDQVLERKISRCSGAIAANLETAPRSAADVRTGASRRQRLRPVEIAPDTDQVDDAEFTRAAAKAKSLALE